MNLGQGLNVIKIDSGTQSKCVSNCTECPKKKYQLGKTAVTQSFFGLLSIPRTVLKYSGSGDFKTVLAFQNWWENAWDNCCQSCQPLNPDDDQIINGVSKFTFFSAFSYFHDHDVSSTIKPPWVYWAGTMFI